MRAIVQNRLADSLLSDPVVAYRLNGHYDFRSGASKIGELRSVGILESRSASHEQGARLRVTLVSTDSFGGDGMRCFIPGLGFTFGSGADTIEILVCLRCYWVYFFQGESETKEALSSEGHRQLTEIYVELFPGNDANAA